MSWVQTLVPDGDRVNGWLFLGIAFLMCLATFLNGRRFARMSDEEALDGRVLLELPAFTRSGRERTKGEAARLFGRISMVFAPLFFLFVAALCFGLLGPVNGIETIKLS